VMAQAGQRTRALAAYERFAGHLKEELDVEPTPETRALANEMRKSDAGSSVPRVLSVESQPVTHITGAPAARRRSRRWVVAACLAVTAIAAAAQLSPGIPKPDPRQLRVEAFRTADTGFVAAMALALTRDVRESLVQIENVQVVAADVGDDALEMFQTVGTKQQDTERGDRAGTIVRGSIRLIRDSVEIQAEVVDRTNGLLLGALRINVDPGNPGAFIERLKVAVATALYPGWGSALSQPLSYQSYRLMLDGLRSLKREVHDDALAAFSAAFTADSSFTAAGLLAAMELYQLNRYAAADTIVQRIAVHRAALRPIDAQLFDWISCSLRGDRSGARAAMSRVTELAPAAELAWLQLAVDNVELARPAEALAALARIDTSSAFSETWPSYWATRIEALHIMRDHQRELAVARAALERHPEVSILASYELRAQAALGYTADVMRAVRGVAALPSGGGTDVPTTIRQAGLELAAHGYAVAADSVFAVAEHWYESRPKEERARPNARAGLGRIQYLRHRDASARAIYDSLAREMPSCLDCAAISGVLAARQGDTAAVRLAEDALMRIERPFLFGRPLLWRARIAAALGDSARAASLLTAAFAAGAEFDVMTHADIELSHLDPDRVYLMFARRLR
jgi:TolB-like protein